MQEVLRAGGFELNKWKSNCESCLDQVVDSTSDNSGCALLKDTTVLGLKWFPETDELAFKVQPFSNENKVTKRSILSCVAQLYDPIGYLGPTNIIARTILRRCRLIFGFNGKLSVLNYQPLETFEFHVG